MAKRTSDNNGNENLRAAGQERTVGMQADAREAHSGDRAFHNNASVTNANAGVQMLDLDSENAESEVADDGGNLILAQAPQGAVAAAGAVGGGKVIGTIQLVVGDVKIMGLDGVIRLAQVGDKVMFKETILTGADGIVQIRLENGQFVDVGRNAKLALDTDFFGYDAGQGLQAATGSVPTPPAPAAEAPAKPAAPGADVAALQAAIARGQDPSQIAPATAAGGAPAAGGVGGDSGGSTPVVVDQANTFGPVTAGFNTAGGSILFPTPEFALLGSEEGPAGIAVVKTGPATVNEGGAGVTWHVVITNNSESTDPVTLTSVVDDQLGDITTAVIAANGGQPIVLEAGASFQFDFSPAGDVDVILNAGQTHTNIVTVEGEDDEGEVITGDDDHTITGVNVAPSITVLKTGPATIAEGGDDAAWTFTITNTSVSTDPVTVSSVIDNLLGNLTAAAIAANGGQPIVLAPGGSFSFTFNPEGDLTLDGGQTHVNTAVVTAVDDEGTQTTGQDDHTITGTDVDPSISVGKTGPATIAEGGTDVTWHIKITNNSVSTDPVTITAIADDQLGNLLAAAEAVNGGPIVLASGASFEFDYNPDGELVLDGGQTHTNVVTVTAVDDEGSDTTGQDDHTITGTDVDPSITVLKSGPATIAEGGQDVTWTFTITNNSVSTDPVTVTAINDDKLGNLLAAAEAQNGGPIVLAAGDSFQFTYNPDGDLVIDGGETYTNVVTVTAEDDEGSDATDDDSHTITGTDVDPTITVQKSGPATVAEGGEDVTWHFVITNTSVSTDPVTITAISDDKLGNLLSAAETANGGPIVLGSGATFEFDYNPEGDLVLDGNESHTNVVTVTGVDDEGSGATDDDDHTIRGTDVAPAIHIEKSSTTVIVNEGEETSVTYTYTVTNTSQEGTDPLTITSLIDDNGTSGNTGDDFDVVALGTLEKTGGDQDGLLEQGETWTYSVNRDVTIQEGGNSFTNIAVVTAVDNEGTQASDDDDHTIVGDDTPQIGETPLVAVDEDHLENGNQDNPVSPGDDAGTTEASADFPINFGADWDGATVSFADLNGDSVVDASNQAVTTSAGTALTYEWDATTNTLSAVDGEGNAAFTLVVSNPTEGNEGGSFTFTLLQALEHAEGEGPEDNTEDPNIVLSLTYTASDSDNPADQALGSVQITIDDDMPTIDVGRGEGLMPDLTTQDAQTIGGASDTDSGQFASLFSLSSDVGADDGGIAPSLSYELSVTTGATSLTSDGLAITVAMDGDDIVGSTSGGEIFRITVNAGTGEVTLTQHAEIDHLPEDVDGVNDNNNLGLAAGNVVLTASATIVDGDNDSDSDSQALDISGAFSFDDDLPTVDVGLGEGLMPDLTTQDAQTIGGASDTDSGQFASLFSLSSDVGADDGGIAPSLSYELSVTTGATSLTSDGLAITVAMDGDDIVGSTSGGDIFRITVNAGTGEVTLTQHAEIDHLPEDVDGVNDNNNLGLAAGNVVLTASATIVDGDNDSDSDSQALDISGAFSFDDDLPTVDVGLGEGLMPDLTTQDAQTIGGASDTDSGQFASLFSLSSDVGADDGGIAPSLSYELSVTTGATSLTSDGLAITVAMDGDDIVGSTSGGDIFRITVNAGTGEVTLTQHAEIDHLPEDVDGVNDNNNLGLAAGNVVLTASATIVDGDNDSDSDSQALDISGAFSFDDDLPTVDVGLGEGLMPDLTTQDAQTIGGASDTDSGQFASLFSLSSDVGADDGGIAPSLSYELSVTTGATSLTSDGLAITVAMDGDDIVGSTSGGRHLPHHGECRHGRSDAHAARRDRSPARGRGRGERQQQPRTCGWQRGADGFGHDRGR